MLRGEISIDKSKIIDNSRKKKEWYQKIDTKVQAIKDITSVVKECGRDDVGEIKKRFDKIWMEISAEFSEEVNNGNKRYSKVLVERHKKINQMRETGISSYEDSDLDDFDDRIFNEINELEGEIKGLEKNKDIIFLHKVEIFLNDLIKKKEKVLELQEFFLENDILPEAELPINLQGVNFEEVDIDFSGYCINLIFKEGAYNDFFQDSSSGRYFKGTVFNAIDGSVPNVDKVIAHEEMHGLTDSFSEKPFYVKELIEELGNRIASIAAVKSKNEMVFKITGGYTSVLQIINRYMSRQYEEIVADIDSLANGNINTFLTDFKKAAVEVRKLLNTTVDEDVKERLLTEWIKEEDKFIKYLAHLSMAIFVSQKTEHFDDLSSLLILFKPGETIKLEKEYLKEKIGPDVFLFYVAIQPLLLPGGFIKDLKSEQQSDYGMILDKLIENIDRETINPESTDIICRSLMLEFKKYLGEESFFDLDRLAILNITLERIDLDSLLTEEDREEMQESINRLDFTSVNLIGQTTAETLKLLEDIYGIIEKLNLKNLEESVVALILEEYVSEAVRTEQFDDFEKVYSEWPESGRRERDEWLRNYTISEDGLILDYKAHHNRKEWNENNIQDTAFWKKLDEMKMV